jgi:formylmethanofuran dehydrogenase subunit A
VLKLTWGECTVLRIVKKMLNWEFLVEDQVVGFQFHPPFMTGQRYAQMGYTHVMEAAMPPLLARHTHEEFIDTPIIDHAAYPLFGNNWFVMEYLKEGDLDGCAAYASWLLKATKGYTIKKHGLGEETVMEFTIQHHIST